MADKYIQPSFNSGEWSPNLYARVDPAKYRSGAALLRNFFIDYRGGATRRPGTKYIQTCLGQANTVRLLPFQASFTISYMLEFGQNAGAGYVRFYNSGASVLEAPTTISGVTQANPGVVTDTAHGYANGDWIFISGIGGMTQLNGNYYLVTNVAANTYTLRDLFGNAINTTTYGAFTSNGTAQRVYTIASPYLASELQQIKYAQSVNTLILCHPNHPPYALTLISATNWTLTAITFGSTITAPVGQAVASTLGAGTVAYAYVVTAVDVNGQESPPSNFASIGSLVDIRTVAGTNTVSWTAKTGAVSYNIYRAEPSYAGAIPSGAQFGFIGNSTGTSFIDSNIAPNFSLCPPVPQNPFSGSGVQNLTLTANGNNFTSVPTVTIAASPGITATAVAYISVSSTSLNSVTGGPGTWTIGQIVSSSFGVSIQITGVTGGGSTVSSWIVTNHGSSSTVGPATLTFISTQGTGGTLVLNTTWNVTQLVLTNPGTGYLVTPGVSITGGGGSGATATATLGAASSGNPTVPGFFQQRLVLAGPVNSPQQFNMSKPAAYYNFDTSNPVQADDAFSGTLVSGQLNTVKSLIPMPAGLIILSDKQAWLLNGGSSGSAVSALAAVANAQAYNGSADLPPIIANFEILYVQSKGSFVRDLTYNFYANIFTGTDISVLSAHLFYGYTLHEWAWAEEPFKVVWAVRSDGQILLLTFLKEQELTAWTHADTNGSFQSVAAITEQVSIGSVDAIYTIVQRTINATTVQYVERVTEIPLNPTRANSWFVDAGIGYSGAAATTFTGANHLSGAICTGVADGVVINFTMPAGGTFVFGPGGTTGLTGITSASVVTVGLGYTSQLQTLPLDMGEPTIQGKVKKINNVDVRVVNTLSLSIGPDFSHLAPMKDLVVGNVSSMLTGQSSQIVTDLYTGDARTWITSTFTVPGQYCIQITDPYPATILGVIPDIEGGDTPK